MSENAAVVSRVFSAPIEKVWAAWTDPEQIARWWGPRDFTAPHIEIDFKEGGTYLYAMHGPAGTPFDMDMWSTGTFLEIVPMKRIVCTDSFADAEGNIVSPASMGMDGMAEKMQVTVEFEALPGHLTRLTITHAGAPAGSEHEANMEAGWHQSLGKFADVVEC